MKIAPLKIIIYGVAILLLSCKGKRESNAEISYGAPESAVQTAGESLESPADPRTIDSKYGKLDAEGFPIDPDLAMNSGKITTQQLAALRQPLPKGYHIGSPIIPKYISGKEDGLEWRKVWDGNFNTYHKDALAKLLGLDVEQLPPSVFVGDSVLKSPSGKRIIVQGNNSNRSLLFEAREGVIDVSTEKNIHSVNFDDRRRAFISWISFVSESLIVGTLADDEDVEKLPSRHIIYTFDIDAMLLRRIVFPKDVQEEEGGFIFIDSVASPSTILVRWDSKKEPITVYLDTE